jgi:hypothetical protein
MLTGAVSAAFLIVAACLIFVIRSDRGVIDVPTGVKVHLAHSIIQVRFDSFAKIKHFVFDDDYRNSEAAIAAAAGISLEQEHALSDFIFQKTKFVSAGSHSNGSNASFSHRSLGSNRGDTQFFVRMSSHFDVRALLALQIFAGGRVISHVQEGLYVAIGGISFPEKARRFAGVLWVQEREPTSKISIKLQHHLRRLAEDSAAALSQKYINIIAECWYDGCGDAAVSLQASCPVVYVHSTLVEGRCLPHSLHSAVSVLASHVAIDHISIKRTVSTKNFGGASIISSGPDALQPDSSLVLRINVTGSIIGVADSGIDMNNCFFYDNASSQPWQNSRVVHTYAVPPCQQCGKCCGPNSPATCSNELNACGNYNEQTPHGSHVSCTIAGAGPSHVSYGNGIAAGAKIYFVDIENILNDTQCFEPGACSSSSIGVPTDYQNLFGPQFDAGVRVSSNSWGGSDKGVYSEGSRMIDAFVSSHTNFVVVFAAGNKGLDAFAGTCPSQNHNITAFAYSISHSCRYS